jgi:hypothetical protein
MSAAASPQHRYRSLVDAIGRECRISEWRAGDVDLWPIASQDLFGDLFRQSGTDTAARRPSLPLRAAASLATPATNLWKSRSDLAHWLPRPHRADALFLGDGVSLDRIDGAWRDRFGEPIASALDRRGRSSLMMQAGNLARLPWARRTFAANRIAARAALEAALGSGPELSLPDHGAAMRLVEQAGIDAPSLTRGRLARRARTVAAQAAAFERILSCVRPATAFVTTYYAGLGHAFALACRRRGVLCVDLQHCPHGAGHRAYHWPTNPARGYSTLPGLFWTWTEQEAADIGRWADGRWHDAMAGGHAQIAGLPASERESLWQDSVARLDDSNRYDREILVALQPIGGKRRVWDTLAAAIQAAPPNWRWWIRRHPASTASQDREYESLLSLRGPSVVVGAEAEMPLPALLEHADALVSLASGAAAEAAMFGVPAFFLDDEALSTFPRLVDRGQAQIVDAQSLVRAIESARRAPRSLEGPSIDDTLRRIERLSADYEDLCRSVN